MKETFSRPGSETPDRESETRTTWSRAERFLENRKMEVLERVRNDIDRFLGSEENVLYGLRTLAAAIELGIVSSPPDTETVANIERAIHRTDKLITEAFSSEDGRKILSGLGIYEDRLTVDRWIGSDTHRQPLIADGTRQRIMQAAEHYVSDTDRYHAEGMRYASILFRAGLFPDIPERKRAAFLGSISRYIPDAVDRGADMLNRELGIDMEGMDTDCPAPHATYGLFVLSDVKILIERRNL